MCLFSFFCTGKEDTKISLHATIHIMDPAEHHKKVIEACLRRVKKDCPSAYAAMTEKDSLKKGIHSVPELEAMGDYAGFMAMDTAMTNNWHQPIQSIGSSKGIFRVMVKKSMYVVWTQKQKTYIFCLCA